MDLNLMRAMIDYEEGCPQRIQHFLKVHAFAMLIAEAEKVGPDITRTLSAAALVHDIGIRKSLEKYGSADGKWQQIEGPPIAMEMLRGLGYPEPLISRVCLLVSRHHTYTNIDEIGYQILVEADFLVNIFEGELSREAAREVLENIFRTGTGKDLLCKQFLSERPS